jgi:hypothetical protein
MDSGEGRGVYLLHYVQSSGIALWNMLLTCTQLVYMDFKPKIWKQGNQTVDYTVKTCDEQKPKLGL